MPILTIFCAMASFFWSKAIHGEVGTSRKTLVPSAFSVAAGGRRMVNRPMSRKLALMVMLWGPPVLCGCKHSTATLAIHPNAQNQVVATQAKAINDRCPIPAFRAIDPRIPAAIYKGHTIAFCCPLCHQRWEHWTIAQKDAFVARQLARASK